VEDALGAAFTGTVDSACSVVSITLIRFCPEILPASVAAHKARRMTTSIAQANLRVRGKMKSTPAVMIPRMASGHARRSSASPGVPSSISPNHPFPQNKSAARFTAYAGFVLLGICISIHIPRSHTTIRFPAICYAN
jgi:hypothetical protein